MKIVLFEKIRWIRLFNTCINKRQRFKHIRAMCQEQPYLALKDVSCFRANGYAVVLFYYNHGLNFASLCLGIQ